MEESNPVPDPPLPRHGEFRVALPVFEGPLDLLLHLIKKHELDILDLPVAFITERYLEYLKFMQELDLDLAGEYLVMAATLAHIKSKMLLPQSPQDQQDEAEAAEEQDPRLELIRRLLEYQKYKEAAEKLGTRAVAGRDVFARGASLDELQGPAPLAEVGLFKLLDAFEAILARAKDRLAFEVNAERISIQERITQLTEMLRERKACEFEELFAGDVTRYEIVITFLALLEMTKLRVTRIYQAEPGAPLHVHYALLDADAPTIPPPEGAPAGAAEARGEAAQDGAELAGAAPELTAEQGEAERGEPAAEPAPADEPGEGTAAFELESDDALEEDVSVSASEGERDADGHPDADSAIDAAAAFELDDEDDEDDEDDDDPEGDGDFDDGEDGGSDEDDDDDPEGEPELT